MGAPVGPSGTALSCNGDFDALDSPPRWRSSLAYSLSGTEIIFPNDEQVTLRRRVVSAALEYQAFDWMSLRLSGGATINGDLSYNSERLELSPGPLVLLGASFTVVNGRDDLPFVVLGATLSTSYSQMRPQEDPDVPADDLLAIDLRASVAVGKMFWNRVAPYLSARAFGGPVFWEQADASITGSDRYHYQFGAGMLVTTGELDAFFEIAPLGERAATFGAALSF